MAQTGFDFGEDRSKGFVVEPEGTWSGYPEFTASEYEEMLMNAEQVIKRIAGPARALFRQAIEAARDELASEVRHRKGGKRPFVLTHCGISLDTTRDHVEMLFGHCENMRHLSFQGIEYKVQNAKRQRTAAMYVAGAGTLEAFVCQSAHRTVGIEYFPCKSHIFLPSYEDNMPAYKLAESVWRDAYAAQQLAESGKGIASVRPFQYQGRKYVMTGGMWFKNQAECTAWELCPIDDWKGPTFNYQSHIDAYDMGTLQRGDTRGLVVKVKGQLYVMASGATFYDDTVPYDGPADEEEEEEDDDELDENDSEDERQEEVTEGQPAKSLAAKHDDLVPA